MVTSIPISNKDLQAYRDELLAYKDFNAQNEDLYEIFQRSSLFNKMQYKAGTRLIRVDDLPVMLIWSEVRNYTAKIRAIIPFPILHSLAGDALFREIMVRFLDSLPVHMDIRRMEYQVRNTPENERILDAMGFKVRKGILMMRSDISDILPPLRPVDVKRYSMEDLKARVEIQNQIFSNKYRIPINSADVILEISKRSFIPELSLFLVKDGKYVGYGQITSNDRRYFLVNFGLTEDYRGQGLSRPFLQEILFQASLYGIREVHLEVNASNLRAIRLYESMGFQEEQNNSTWIYDQDELDR